MEVRHKIIFEKLNYLRNLDFGKWRIFGSETHRYQLNPPISEDNLADYETSNGIKLPEEYRNFLAEVGNGGVGPSYGWYGISPQQLDDKEKKRLQTPFPLTNKQAEWLVTIFNEARKMPYPSYFLKNEVGYFEAPNTFFGDFAQKYFEYDHFDDCPGCFWDCPGLLYLVGHGCNWMSTIVLDGEQKGIIWDIDENGFSPPAIYLDGNIAQNKPIGFLDWYENWLDESIGKLTR